ncbi:DUF2089 domain-containing protein [Jiangella sp. DSM 45060]|uniref:DUF2089 domain-containing protein n=1 Tax=Jiangella sp. DSM 45060 TaxID=1798224 RepID=UPI000879EB2D|nr:DUF2089 domain-containing protein [Jiangella sp. DSM 45060]SDT56190.1 hypothetical protein SAMN04515669_4779 [Jiangella sp. DSM 45060]
MIGGFPQHLHQPPSDCPVCGVKLHVTRLGCESCGTELSGRFASCPYCSLTAQDQKILGTFLVSRGNMRELARELGVSYPTARQRFAELLERLGLEAPAETAAAAGAVDREEILRRLAAGELDLDEATALLG